MTEKKPILFISHKHVDKPIADALRNFVETNTAGAVDIYQSSAWQAAGPRTGKDLIEELRLALWRTDVFILIHTDSSLDWSYCIFEYGLANAANSAPTNSILFRCSQSADDVPLLFAHQVHVNACDLGSIKKFANDLLTAPRFFPNHVGPITCHQPGGSKVEAAAEHFYRTLEELLPPWDAKGWPAYPFFRFQLDREHVAAIVARLDGVPVVTELTKKLLRDVPMPRREVFELIQAETRLIDHDDFAVPLFKSPGFKRGMKLKTLIETWRMMADGTNLRSRWIEALCWQIGEAAREQFPPFTWEPMQGVSGDKSWYAPRVMHVWRLPQGHANFDVYFINLDFDAAKQSRSFWRWMTG